MSQKDEIMAALTQAMSSEHTSYKSTKKFLAALPTASNNVIAGPGENAGIVDLGSGYALAFRIESHNHPTFIDPYRGAASGVGGILRDIFTMGARPIALLDMLYFGTNKHSQKLLQKTVQGISDYGNCVGVPTIGGSIYFDKTYDKNCLVNVFAAGLVKKDRIVYGQAKTSGNDLIYVGARTGRDGVGGAEMASKNLNKLDKSFIQDADPFLEKLLLEACCELSEAGLIEGMQDMGAAGLLCSTAEMVLRGQKIAGKDLGAKLFLNQIPLKSAGMTPIEILLSESQERMMIVSKRQNRQKILNTFKKWDLEARVVGKITTDSNYTVVYDQNRKKNLEVSFPINEIFPDLNQDWKLTKWKTQKSQLRNPNSKAKSQIWHQYDWMVGIRTIKGPNRPGQYAVLDLPEIKKELILTWSGDQGKSNFNPKAGIELAFDNCINRIRNLGAKPLGLVNCLNFGHPKDSMGAFAQTIEALTQLCKSQEVPVVGGNVSLYNAYKNHSIKPTPVLVMVGLRQKIN